MKCSRRMYPWFNPYVAAQSNFERVRIPIHYNLKRLDFMAARAELERGADPSMTDEYGRTALDIVVQMVVELIETILCTSFPVDFIDESLYKSCLMPKYDETYRNMYDRLNCYRYKDNSLCPSETSNVYYAHPYPVGRSFTCQKCLGTIVEKAKKKNVQYAESKEKQPCFLLPESSSNIDDTPPTKCQLVQQHVLLVVENAFEEPLSGKIIARMHELLRRLKAASRFMNVLAECSCLKEYSLKVVEAATQQIMYPFFYTALMHTSFKVYRFNPTGDPWDTENPADARRLVSLIIDKELRGHEMFRLLGAVLKYIVNLVECFGKQIINQYCDVAQYWMHMAFVLDSPTLFEIIVSQPNIFSNGHLFKWENLLYALMQHKYKFSRYTAALLHVCLKARIRKRLEEKKSDEEVELFDNVNIPCEERYLKKDVINEYSDLYGEEEARELENILKKWKYGAYRTCKKKDVRR